MTGLSKISANSLFHFTERFENLISILEHTFYPRYCLEDIATLEDDLTRSMPRFAIPVVCFCDIPLSQVQDHSKTYGNYAIGLTKEWGKRNNLNPIFYAEPNSLISKTLRRTADILNRDELQDSIQKTELRNNHTTTAVFLKPYKGRLFRNGAYLQDQVTFYNEREWRHAPPIENLEKMGVPYVINGKAIQENKNIISISNQKLVDNNIRLTFEPNDIKYLIVEKDGEILSLCHELQRIKGDFSEDARTLLTTRIISMENIREDF